MLAALIIHAVSHLWKVAQFRRYYTEHPAESWLGLATLAGVITLDVLPGLLIGVISMLLLLIYHATRPDVSVLGRVPHVPGAFGAIERHPDYDPDPDLLVLRLETPLFYANAAPIRDRIKTLVGEHQPPPNAVIVDAGANERLDITSAEMLTQLTDTLRSAGINLALADARQPLIEMARRAGLLERLGENRIFHTIEEAVQALSAEADSPHETPP